MNARMESILIVDDRDDVLRLHAEILGTAGYEITTAADPRKALELVKDRFFDLLVLDDRMQGISGRQLLKECREHDPDIGAIFVSAFSDPETLTDVIRLGATDYLVKPASESQLQCAVARALGMTRRQRQWRWLRQQIGRDTSADTLLGNCAEIQRIREQMRKIAARPNIDVLVTGETGTGKELVAAGLHRLSAHAAGPFLVCHLGGLSSSLIAAELFGVSKGAFTNAEEDRVGYFEAAHGGTLFLDEIGEMPLTDQAMLLRAVETREVVPVGSTRPRKFDTRLVAATNRDLRQVANEGKFRRDLLARLDVMNIHLPPLRDRTGDVEVLTPTFVESLCAELKRTAPVIPPETLKRLVQYHWPANVRELRNTLKRALVLSDEPELAPELITFGDDTADDDLSQECLSKMSYEEACRAFDRRYLTAILGRAEGNKTEAAKLAKFHRTTIYDKLRDCGLSERTPEEDR